jgi:hypothetical protein
VQQVITNAIRWAAPTKGPYTSTANCSNPDPLEEVKVED